MKTMEFVIYRNMKYKDLLNQITALLAMEPAMRQEAMPESYECASQLADMAVTYGLEGNLWHCFLTLSLVLDENPYSISCEIKDAAQGTVHDLAKHDFRLIRQLFHYDIRALDHIGGLKATGIWTALADYHAGDANGRVFDKKIRDQIITLAVSLAQAVDVEAFDSTITEFYHRLGVGKLGLNKAFRIREADEKVNIDPIINVELTTLDDIIGYRSQKQKLVENTAAFIEGKAANNVLLYGDSGTGKSSSIKAILNEYYDQGLRMIEVYKHQFCCLSGLLEEIKDRSYKFIIYMDDLSFEEFELEYKYLKAIIEGGLGRKPLNVLIYATSNRRHLIREKFSDKQEHDDELHTRDTVQEKLSLVARFGVTIYYGAPDKCEFQEIVRELAIRHQIHMPEDELLLEANRWELHHGGLSGRTANQFITYLRGRT